jgi:hypothetical protein
MYFSIQGLFEGIAAGIATGFILVTLKANQRIELLPLIVIACCLITFGMTFGFSPEVALMGKEEKKEKKTEEVTESV